MGKPLHQFEADEAIRLSQPVDCLGWVVLTIITDNDGREIPQHSPIYRRMSDAEQIAAVTRKPKLWERSIVRTVQQVRTVYPLSDVLAGNATAIDALALLEVAEINAEAMVQSVVGMAA